MHLSIFITLLCTLVCKRSLRRPLCHHEQLCKLTPHLCHSPVSLTQERPEELTANTCMYKTPQAVWVPSLLPLVPACKCTRVYCSETHIRFMLGSVHSHRSNQSSISLSGCAARRLHWGKWGRPCPPLYWSEEGSSAAPPPWTESTCAGCP